MLLVFFMLVACAVMWFAETERVRRFAYVANGVACAYFVLFAPMRYDPPQLWWYDRIGAALFGGAVYVGAAVLYVTQRPGKAHGWVDRDPLAPVGWGDAASWLAIRGADMDAVVAALKLRGAERATWQDGVSVAAPHRWRTAGSALFVAPPVDGWIFVHGSRLADFIQHDVGPLKTFLEDLSVRLEAPVLYYANRAGAYGYARAEGGALSRAVLRGPFGEMEYGEPTAEERKLGAGDAGHDHEPGPRISTVDLAALWGMSPQALDRHKAPTERGWLGRVDALAPAAAGGHH